MCIVHRCRCFRLVHTLIDADILFVLSLGFSQVRAAAASANALEFIEKMPDQFNQLIGESGVEQLSGGQKQVRV
jgi:ABC-type bacteriocin/lantibiotic exporter with double-glycine peptidase domain